MKKLKHSVAKQVAGTPMGNPGAKGKVPKGKKIKNMNKTGE